MTRLRVCNYIKIATGWNFPPVLKIVTRTAQLRKMLMLLSVHVTRVLFLVLHGRKFRPDYGLLLELHALTLVAILMRSWFPRLSKVLCNTAFDNKQGIQVMPLVVVYALNGY